jgi:glycosyltransferase involved in cell wall biosynthesis
MARAIEELVMDKSRLDILRNSGFEAWKQRFSWERIALQYEQLYSRLLES